MKEITFNKAIKIVHPDANPTIENPGDKVRTIMMYKNNPKKMYRCLVNWGLIESEKPKKVTHLIRPIEGLLKNTYYNGNVVIKHKSCYGYLEVERTTSKRVYFTERTTAIHGLKYCHINSVTKAFVKVGIK